MRRPLTLLGFITLVFLLGALLSPWIYRAVQNASGEVAARFAAEPFPRFVSRTLLGLALLGLWPLAKTLGATWPSLGLARPRARDVLLGAALGFAGLGMFVVIAHLGGARDFRPSIDTAKLARSVGLALGAALLVAPLEELLFRGMAFGLLRGRRWIPAMLFSSALFAVVHLLQTPRGSLPQTVEWSSGFVMLVQMCSAQSDPAMALAQVVNLTLCGVILCVSFQRTGNLWFSVALHAGWIFWLKLANAITVVPRGTALAWGTRKIIDGWAVLPVLIATLIAVEWITRRRVENSNVTENSSSVAHVD